MALRFIDGMLHYSIPSQLGLKYSAFSNTSMSSMTGRRSSSTALKMGTQSDVISLTFDSQATWIMGFAYQMMGNESSILLQANDSSGNNQLCAVITAAGTIQLLRGGQYGTILATSSNAIPLNTWNYIEIKMTIASSGGVFEVRVNESVWVTYSGNTLSSSNANANYLQLKGRYSSCAFMDVYVCDGTGSRNNTYLGDCRIDTVRPSAAGTYTQMTPQGSASNYANVNETTLDSDSSYNYSNTAGAIDSFVCSTLTSITGTIFGLQSNVAAEKDDSGSRTVAATTRVSTTDYTGTTQSVSTSYAYYKQIWEQNPYATANWTATTINASEFGCKVIA